MSEEILSLYDNEIILEVIIYVTNISTALSWLGMNSLKYYSGSTCIRFIISNNLRHRFNYMKLIPALMVKVINVVNTEIIANVLMSHSNSACEDCSSACSENNLNCFKASFNIDVVSYLRLIVARVKLAPMSWVFTCNFRSAGRLWLSVGLFFFAIFVHNVCFSRHKIKTVMKVSQDRKITEHNY